MTDIEDKLIRVLAGAADQVPERARIDLSVAVGSRHRPRRAPAALLAAMAVVVVAGGAGTAVRTLGSSAVRQPAVNATGTQGPTPQPDPVPEEKPPPIEKVWPRALHKISAKLPDGRAYHPQSLLDDRTLLVMTGASDGRKQFLWSYDLKTGEPRRITEIPTRNSTLYAEGVTAGGGDIVWWASYKDPGRQRVARIWTVPVGGGTPRKVADVPLENVMKKGHIRALEVVGRDVVFSRESGGVYRVPLRGGEPRAVPGTAGQHLLRWPWVGHHTNRGTSAKRNDAATLTVFAKLFDAETGKWRDAVVKPYETFVRCGVDRCYGQSLPKGSNPRKFVRDRDGSRDRTLPFDVQIDDPGLERFYKRMPRGGGVFLYDLVTGTSADLGVRRDERGNTSIPDGGFDRLMTYRVGEKMYVVDLAAIR
ncbi:TolB family protein [Streptosporangium vulgare]|uniref:TolB family protein n=1 Tax=Streptosporangium vulgare TaxID=46190 RepID=A0ABV5TMR2_9ACTN